MTGIIYIIQETFSLILKKCLISVCTEPYLLPSPINQKVKIQLLWHHPRGPEQNSF